MSTSYSFHFPFSGGGREQTSKHKMALLTMQMVATEEPLVLFVFLFVITYMHYLLGMEYRGLSVLVSLRVHHSGNPDKSNIVKWP